VVGGEGAVGEGGSGENVAMWIGCVEVEIEGRYLGIIL